MNKNNEGEKMNNKMKEYTTAVRTHNDGLTFEECALGTSYQGEIECDYATLVELFGEPFGGDGYKIDAEWLVCLTTKDNNVLYFTLYNWKDGFNYNKDGSGFATHMITNWHIGCNSGNQEAVNSVNEILNELVCNHKNKFYQPEETDTNIPESYTCDDCGKEFDIPEPDVDLNNKE